MMRNATKELAGFLFRISGLPILIRSIICRRKATILVYHNPDLTHFERHLAYLAARFHFIPLRKLVDAIRQRDWSSIPPRALVLTLDDGHVRNYALRHILQKYGVRPTIFLCSHIVDTNRHFWWKTGIDAPDQFKSLAYEQFLTRLKSEVGYEPEKEYHSRQALNRSELAEMQGVADFGSHTRFHPILPACPQHTCLAELRESRAHLQDLLRQPVRDFAYPNGDYTERELKMVASAGYDSARTLDYGWNDFRTDPLRLKACEVDDAASANVLSAQVHGFFPLLRRLRRRLRPKPAYGQNGEQELASEPEILMIGPYPLHQARGGICSVISTYAEAGVLEARRIRYISASSSGSAALKMFALVKALIAFNVTLLFCPIKMVHIHSASWRSFYRKSLFVRLGKLFDKKVLLHLHGGQFQRFYDSARPWQKSFIRKTLESADLLAVVSPVWRHRFRKLASDTRLVTIPNPVNVQHYQPANGSVSSQSQNVLFLGNLCRQKGVFELIRAVPEVVRRVPGARFILCGDGDDFTACKQLCADLGIGDNVKLPGWVAGQQKHQMLRAAAIFVLPSHDEGMPVSILEAMACGLAIVATDVGGIPEMIRHEENGLLVPPGDSEALTEALASLLTNPRKLHEIRQRNLTAVTEYDVHHVAEVLRQVYADLLENSTPTLPENSTEVIE